MRPCRRATVGNGYTMCNLPGYDHAECTGKECGFYEANGCGWAALLVIGLAALGGWSVLIWIWRLI